jgi:hypothetical protein
LDDLSEAEKEFLINGAFLFAEKRAAKGDTTMAVAIYRSLLGRSEREHFKCGVLIGLGKCGSASDVDAMVSALSDESATVRGVAAEALIALKGADVNGALEKAMDGASPDVKESISKVLSARKSQ